MDKHLDIPHIAELDETSSADVINRLLDSKGARAYIDTLNWAEQFPYKPATGFNIAHSGKAIYINFFTREQNIRAVNDANNSAVCNDSCVEFFVEPVRNGLYWNFEFNCIGTIHASSRTDRHNATHLSDAELAKVFRHASIESKPFGDRPGLHSWNLLAIIPLSLIDVSYEGTPINLRANFYKCSDKSAMPHYLSWNAISSDKPNFHLTDFFGTITLL